MEEETKEVRSDQCSAWLQNGDLKRETELIVAAQEGLELYVHGSEERLIHAARGDKIDGLEAASVLKRSKKENIRRLGEKSSTWSVFEGD